METAHPEKRKNSKVIQQTPGCIQDKAMVPGGGKLHLSYPGFVSLDGNPMVAQPLPNAHIASKPTDLTSLRAIF
jgi:hypothetical protein